MTVLLEGLASAFARLGGVPEELLFDQRRPLVFSDDPVGGGELELNAEFLRRAAHRGFPVSYRDLKIRNWRPLQTTPHHERMRNTRRRTTTDRSRALVTAFSIRLNTW